MGAVLGERVCKTCGRPHDAASGIEQIDVRDSELHITDSYEVDGEDLRRSTMALVGVIIALIVLIWGLSRLGNSNPEPRVSPTTPTDATLATSEVSSPEPENAVATEASAPSGATLTPLSSLDFELAYFTESGVARVELATGMAEFLPIESTGRILPIGDLALMSDGTRVVGIDLDESRALLLGAASDVVAADGPRVDFWLVSAADSGVRLSAWHVDGYVAGEVQPPAGSEVIAVPGVGVLVMPPTGGSFLANLDGFEPVSEARVIAATESTRVETTCDEQLSCTTTAVDIRSGFDTTLPEDFMAGGGGISVSPDGRWILKDTTPARSFDLETGAVHTLDVGGFGGAQWSDDSTAFAWLDTTGSPTLIIAFPDGADAEIIDLAELPAPPVEHSGFALLQG